MLNRTFVAHLNLYAGFYEVVEAADGWHVQEHRGRRTPLTGPDPAGGGGAGTFTG